MKINAELLKSFIKMSTANGTLTDCKLRFEDDSIILANKDITSTGAIKSKLYKANFSDYQPNIIITIRDTNRLINVLQNMSGEVTIKVEENAVLFYDGENEATLMMPCDEYLECKISTEEEEQLFENLQFDNGFELDSSKLIKARRNAQTLGIKYINCFVENGVLNIRAGEQTFDKFTIKIPVNYNNCHAIYGTTFLDFVGSMVGTVTISFKENFPMRIIYRNPNYEVTYLISPIRKEDEE